MPDLCLQAIFKRVPLADLLRNVSLVCSRWYRYSFALLHKRSLTLLVGDDSWPLNAIKNNLFTVPHADQVRFTKEDITALSSLSIVDEPQIKFSQVRCPLLKFNRAVIYQLMRMCHVESLEISIYAWKYIDNSPMFDLVRILLGNWSLDLKCFKLHLYSFHNGTVQIDNSLQRFIDAINALPKLGRLLLSIRIPNYHSNGKLGLKWPILPKLSEFFFDTRCIGGPSKDPILNSINAKPNESLHKLGLTSFDIDPLLDCVDQSALSTKLVCLHAWLLDSLLLDQLVSSFGSSLSMLHCTLNRGLNLAKVTKLLSQLSKLLCLRLTSTDRKFQLGLNKITPEQVSPLTSVKTFVLHILFGYVTEEKLTLFSRMLPAVQVVLIDNSVHPHLLASDYSFILPSDIARRHAQVFKQHCAQLRKVYFVTYQPTTHNGSHMNFEPIESEFDVEQI